jgi:hypothetical protein
MKNRATHPLTALDNGHPDLKFLAVLLSRLDALVEHRAEQSSIALARDGAAALVGISPDMLDRERRAGRIGAKYVGTKPIYPVDELRRWLDALPSEPNGAG